MRKNNVPDELFPFRFKFACASMLYRLHRDCRRDGEEAEAAWSTDDTCKITAPYLQRNAQHIQRPPTTQQHQQHAYCIATTTAATYKSTHTKKSTTTIQTATTKKSTSTIQLTTNPTVQATTTTTSITTTTSAVQLTTTMAKTNSNITTTSKTTTTRPAGSLRWRRLVLYTLGQFTTTSWLCVVLLLMAASGSVTSTFGPHTVSAASRPYDYAPLKASAPVTTTFGLRSATQGATAAKQQQCSKLDRQLHTLTAL